MIELLFILGFTLHNIEEALWIPKWSKNAKKYHPEVTATEFHFAVIIVTIIGYLLTFQYFLFGDQYMISKYIYLGFVSMMVLNVLLPHLIATIVLKKYAPGLITGIFLNAPIGLYLIVKNINGRNEILILIIITIVITLILLKFIDILFKIGKKLID